MDTSKPYVSWVPYAKRAGDQLGIDPAFVMAQWLYETGGGTNLGSRKYNNLAGIKSAPNTSKGIFDPPDSIHAGYTDLSAFTTDYIRVMNLGYYRDFLATARKGSVADSLKALNASPWAEADYNTSGFMRYYNEAAAMVGSSPVDLGSIPGTGFLSGVSTDGIIGLLKEKWWMIGGALVLIAVIRR